MSQALIGIFILLVTQIALTISVKISIILGHRAEMTFPLGFKKDSKCIILHGSSTADKALLKE